MAKRHERWQVGRDRSADTGMYVVIHEDVDNRVAVEANIHVMP